MKHSLVFLLVVFLLCSMMPSPETKPFKGKFYNKENDILLSLDLYDTTIVSSNYSFLGKLNGYMSGKIYDVWFVTSFEMMGGEKALVHFSNDLGADAQDILLTIDGEGRLLYEAQGGNAIRRVSGRKWQKVPSKMVFMRSKR